MNKTTVNNDSKIKSPVPSIQPMVSRASHTLKDVETNGEKGSAKDADKVTPEELIAAQPEPGEQLKGLLHPADEKAPEQAASKPQEPEKGSWLGQQIDGVLGFPARLRGRIEQRLARAVEAPRQRLRSVLELTRDTSTALLRRLDDQEKKAA